MSICVNKTSHNYINGYETGYSVVRSLSEAPKYASAIASILKQGHVKEMLASSGISENISMQGKTIHDLKFTTYIFID